MTWPRRIVPGTTYLLTRRCTQRRFMLVPRGIVPKLFGYCVALAAERHGIQVHAITTMSNHYHAVVTDPHGRIPQFCRDVHNLGLHRPWVGIVLGDTPSSRDLCCRPCSASSPR